MLRKCAKGSIVYVFAVALGLFTTLNANATGPVRIGIALPYTGPYASVGQDIERGFKLYMDNVKWNIGGTSVELISEDTEAKPDVGLTKIRKLVERDRVHILTGLVSSAVAYAVRDYVDAKKVPLILSLAGGSDLTQGKWSPYIFRVNKAINQESYPFGLWVYNTLGYRKAIIMSSEYKGGHEYVNFFKKAFIEQGGEVVKELYPPVGTTDFAPYLAILTREKADFVYAFFGGGDAIRFVKQYAEMGLKERIPLVGPSPLIDNTILPSQGDAAIGVVVGDIYSILGDEGPENKEFVKSYRTKHGANPSEYSASGYWSAMVIAEALTATKGKASPEEFVKALRNVDIKAPGKRLRFDRFGQTTISIYPSKVEKKDGTLVKMPIGKIENVGQDVVYKP